MFYILLCIWLLKMLLTSRAFPLPNWDPSYLDDDMDFPDILNEEDYEMMLKRSIKYRYPFMYNPIPAYQVV